MCSKDLLIVRLSSCPGGSQNLLSKDTRGGVGVGEDSGVTEEAGMKDSTCWSVGTLEVGFQGRLEGVLEAVTG